MIGWLSLNLASSELKDGLGADGFLTYFVECSGTSTFLGFPLSVYGPSAEPALVKSDKRRCKIGFIIINMQVYSSTTNP